MPRRSSFVLILALMGLAPEAHAAATAQQSCEAAMELASGKYAQCRLVAESKFSKTLDAAKRTAALTKCSTKLGDAFAKATAKYGGDCAATEPSSDFFSQVRPVFVSVTVPSPWSTYARATPFCRSPSLPAP